MTFRSVKSTQLGGWFNPGYEGAHIFPEVELFIQEEIDRIIEAIL
jgi:hypothetical protein